jgi:serine/threonine-protein kinase
MFTCVYRARPAHASREAQGGYALKLLRDTWHHHPEALARLRNEWIVGRAVSNHRVVSILSAHLHKPPYYIVMPWIEALSVASHLSQQCRLETPVALWIARQTAEGLDALHSSGYLHGDVNPANLLFASCGHVTLIDLSCARRWGEESILDEQAIAGTPIYLAPEIFAGRARDPRTDIYSLGIALYEMLTGRPPVSASNLSTIAEHKLHGSIPNVRVFAPNVSSEVAHFIRRLTARDPLRRPQRARDAIQALLRLEIATLFERVPI